MTWISGTVNWGQVDGINPVIQVYNNARESAVRAYSWRNLRPGEKFYEACAQYAQQFDFAAAGTVVVGAVAQYWNATGTQLIEERAFAFTPDDTDIFVGQ